jgi:hypothetical protein
MRERITIARDWLLGSAPGRLLPRWLFLRGLGLIYFSAFYSLAFQIQGLIGPDGILPVKPYLEAVTRHLGSARFWYAPTVMWLSPGTHALAALWIIGMIASILLVLNLWPRGSLAICFLCYLSFIAAAQDFSSYQSDGMLLEAGFLSFFFAPRGLRPGLGERHPPSRVFYFLLLWLWFRIYFESGVAKWMGGDPQWRHLTAMDQYYQNGPLPTWIGWYVEQLPHWFHAAAAALTLALEIFLVWLAVLPRRWRILCFCLVTPWQAMIILTANYTFLNYLVLLLGVLLLDDRLFARWMPQRLSLPSAGPPLPATENGHLAHSAKVLYRSVGMFFAAWIFYATAAQLVWMFSPALPLPGGPVQALEPFRIANQFGLFGRMTLGRYEIEFQGSEDGLTWTAYPFRYKPQDPKEAPRIYAPYQPRFDWNLWFASLGSWRENLSVLHAQERLLEGSGAVVSLFAGNPFPKGPPRYVRTVVWQYWFTDRATKRAEHAWWRRQMLGLYSPTLERGPDGSIGIVRFPGGTMMAPPE